MPRRCFLDPIPEITNAAALLDQAATRHLEGKRGEAARLIREANIPAIRLWTESIWGKRSPAIHVFVEQSNAHPHLAMTDRLKPRMPTAVTKQALLRRDGFHCRFCGIPVIPAEVRRHLQRVYPDALSWGSRNVDQHAAFQCMWLQWDHLVPNERGGSSDLENMVVTCAPCNFGRMQMTIEEVDLIDPLTVPLAPTWSGYDHWDGLTRVLT